MNDEETPGARAGVSRRSAAAVPSAPSASGPGFAFKGERVAVAIPAFQNITGRADVGWLGLAIAETLTSKLGNVARLKVIERNRMDEILKEMALAQSGLVETKFMEFGKMAGAQHLIIGSFQALGDKDNMMIKVTARAVDTVTGVVVQGQGIDAQGSFKDIFALQDRLAESITATLRVEVTPDEKKRVSAKETSSVAAYELFWLARAEGDPARKITLLRKAVEMDSGYALAHLNLAGVLFAMSMNQPENPEVEKHALEAARLDGTLADAYNVAGTYYDRLAFAQSKAGNPAAKQTAARAIENYKKFVQTKADSDSVLYKGQVERAKRKIEELSKI